MGSGAFLGCAASAGGETVRVAALPESRCSLPPSTAELGPGYIRMASQYISDSGIPAQGLVDMETGLKVCASVCLRDVGDFEFPRSLEEARALQEQVFMGRQGVSVLLLGDDACNFPLLVNRTGLLIHIDAHDDRSPHFSRLTHANFLRLLTENSPGLEVIQVGLRGLLNPDRRTAESSRVTVWREGLRSLSQKLKDVSVDEIYIAVDLDVLDPLLFPDVACPVPGGMTFKELEEGVIALARDARVHFLSFSEFAPRSDVRNSLLSALRISNLIVKAVDASAWSRERVR